MSKVFNFGAGPAKLPEEVYEIIKNELTNFENSGISLLETSHRSSTYMKLNVEIQDVVRNLLDVPDNYKVLFLAGGGLGQFAAVPLNLISRTGTADYVVTGAWSAKAAKEAKKYGKVNLVLPPTDKYEDIPDQTKWNLDPNASYVHICTNETIHGVEFDFIPDTKGVPLIADMSSNIMSKKVDVSKFGVIYAGAQKNIGTSGVALVIVREDLLNQALPTCPSLLDWTANYKQNSILNTPPMFAIYIMGRVLQWIQRNGGLEGMSQLATKKASLIYNTIEQSNGFYYAPVAKNVRSKMNVPFRIGCPGDDALEKEFLKGAETLGLIQLKGHRDVGGIRASIYNAVTLEEVQALVQYMEEFYKKHSK
ncbi:probable phosphoserine aminotransferase [Bombyx mandarina]|uniref:Phosphoserine aminotransferase n=2 Tax=Bombyx TaxID=7090 RepID=Q2F5M8_BOMMO|nr:phosphoserine aminotransferase 1 [Bombyx mori]XP_028025902.1 probable phosphoserine aminotransferase [Bombyx mandarina]ABD36339.1 phosphoserine aminotransferase [Bombyx mori]AIU94616.1 phosphoserine aminotransferase [Bombyx mori]